MQTIKSLPLIAMVIMAILSFSNLIGLNIAGMSVVIGVVFFFIVKTVEKKPFKDSGLDFAAIKTNLKGRSIWFWLLLPLIMDAVSITLSKLFLPEYIEHVLARSDAFISFDKIVLMLFQLAYLALGEEIAWRAFFQKQLNKVLPIVPTLLISSLFFAFGHISVGNSFIVTFDIFFVFINSILYGIIFYKTNNAWVSALSHFIANLFSIIIFMIL
ncbi:CPBP family intramembrane glutamic endopeptidase [Bacillus marasmi]|uniref:CPBP family intramembrane glutamic endopeptidase n=1 Tax=Bacillus marasmi TaxID=1926279 RepID=UPI00164D1352|nr:type II CAAX endopeptidase family protein [Bacillus marasmi]